MVPVWLAVDRRVGNFAIRLFAVLAGKHADRDTHVCIVRRRDLANDLDVAPSTIDIGLAELKAAGAVTAEQRWKPARQPGRHHVERAANRYILNFDDPSEGSTLEVQQRGGYTEKSGEGSPEKSVSVVPEVLDPEKKEHEVQRAARAVQTLPRTLPAVPARAMIARPARGRPLDVVKTTQVIVAVWSVLAGKVLPQTLGEHRLDDLAGLEAQISTWLEGRGMVAELGTIPLAIEHVRFQQQRRRRGVAGDVGGGRRTAAPNQGTPRAARAAAWPVYRWRPSSRRESSVQPGEAISRVDLLCLFDEWRKMPPGAARDAERVRLAALLESFEQAMGGPL